uniref:Spermatogenesis associated 6 n=2 Tax=Myripristis murdjan TaxID=586833 RepID=A0A667WGN5_9TELE
MKRSHSFPGISPKVEFATASVIEESDGEDSRPTSPPRCLSPVMPSLSSPGRTPAKPSSSSEPLNQSPPIQQYSTRDGGNCSSLRNGKQKQNAEARKTNSAWSSTSRPPPSSLSNRGSGRNKKERQQAGPGFSVDCGYQQPTVASRTRALSPYTHRRMCQLSEDARQRLSHLQLGPHRFRKETESQPPFLVSSCSSVSVMETPCSQHLSSPMTGSMRHSHSASFTADHMDSSVLGSYRPRTARFGSGAVRGRSSPETPSRREVQIRTPGRGADSSQFTLSASSSRGPQILSKSSLRERFQSSPRSPTHWEQIHSRVQRILQTHRSTQKYQVTL